MTSHLINLLEKMAIKKTNQTKKTPDRDINNELKRLNQENRRQYQEIWNSLNKIEKKLLTLQKEPEKGNKRRATREMNTTEDENTVRSSSD